MILRPTVFPGAVVVSSDLTLRTFHTPKPQLTRMTDPCCDVANLLTPDRFWKSVDRRGRYFAGLARVCRAHPGRGRPIVCPVKRTQRGIIPWRVTYTAAKQSRMDRVRILGGNSRDDCKRQRSLISNQIPGLREGKRRRKWNWAFRSRNDLKRILAFFLFYEFFCGTEEDEIACIAWTDSFTLSRWKRSHVRRWLR